MIRVVHYPTVNTPSLRPERGATATRFTGRTSHCNRIGAFPFWVQLVRTSDLNSFSPQIGAILEKSSSSVKRNASREVASAAMRQSTVDIGRPFRRQALLICAARM